MTETETHSQMIFRKYDALGFLCLINLGFLCLITGTQLLKVKRREAIYTALQ